MSSDGYKIVKYELKTSEQEWWIEVAKISFFCVLVSFASFLWHFKTKIIYFFRRNDNQIVEK